MSMGVVVVDPTALSEASISDAMIEDDPFAIMEELSNAAAGLICA